MTQSLGESAGGETLAERRVGCLAAQNGFPAGGLSERHSPLREGVVGRPVGDAAYEQRLGIVARAGSKVFRTVGEGNVDPRHPVVHRGEHGEGLIRQEFQEARRGSGVLLLHDVDNLSDNDEGSRFYISLFNDTEVELKSVSL